MVNASISGSIVNISSTRGNKEVGPLSSVYDATKVGVESVTRSVAEEMAQHGIRCNTVRPGFIETPLSFKVAEPEYLQSIVEKTPLGRGGKPEEIANVVHFLISDKSSFMTGESVQVSGGYYM